MTPDYYRLAKWIDNQLTLIELQINNPTTSARVITPRIERLRSTAVSRGVSLGDVLDDMEAAASYPLTTRRVKVAGLLRRAKNIVERWKQAQATDRKIGQRVQGKAKINLLVAYLDAESVKVYRALREFKQTRNPAALQARDRLIQSVRTLHDVTIQSTLRAVVMNTYSPVTARKLENVRRGIEEVVGVYNASLKQYDLTQDIQYNLNALRNAYNTLAVALKK